MATTRSKDDALIDPAELPERTELVFVVDRNQLAVILEGMQRAGVVGWTNLMRLALDDYIKRQLGVEFPPDTFRLRSYRPHATDDKTSVPRRSGS